MTMTMKPYTYEAVLMTTQATGTPHAAHLQAANEGLVAHVRESVQGVGDERLNLWRNCDRNIREWWRANRAEVQTDSVLFLEWDVFCDVDLRKVIPPLATGCGIAAASIVTPVTAMRSYWPFEDLFRLPREMQGLACATAPLAVLLISRVALDAVLATEYDAIFDTDIFCELRLPTIIRYSGFGVAAMDLPNVHCTPCQPTFADIWHPVKTAIL